jgi:hypothetical protein
MSDFADEAEERTAQAVEVGLRENASKVFKIPVGIPGECDRCGESSPRIVLGNCCRCRDKYKLG